MSGIFGLILTPESLRFLITPVKKSLPVWGANGYGSFHGLLYAAEIL